MRWRSPPVTAVSVSVWAAAKSAQRQGTAGKKSYQMNDAAAMGLAVSEWVTVAMAELVVEVQEGLLEIAVGAGLEAMAQCINADVDAVCRLKGKHGPARAAARHGTEAGLVTFGGGRFRVVRPRMSALDWSGEVAARACELVSQIKILGRMAIQRMLAGLSTRSYPVGLETVGTKVESAPSATSKSAVSRRFGTATASSLAEPRAAPLQDLEPAGLTVAGVLFGG